MCNSSRIEKKRLIWAVAAALPLGLGNAAWADVFNMPSGETSLSFVTVGDPGNVADVTGFGAVPYTYQLGTYDMTAGQYCEMLNAVAKTDPYGLYNSNMYPGGSFGACGIVQSGSSGSYTYSVAASNENFPVNDVSWGEAARFCNWLANGQPTTGVENAGTTEDGSYALNGAVTDGQLAAVTRSPSATYVIPTENEWYKAAYYKGGSTNAGYWLYPTQSNTAPSNVLSILGSNNANFYDPVLGLTSPSSGLTPVGSFADSPGPWGNFDMGGDVYQWNETITGSTFGIRGGEFNGPVSLLESNNDLSQGPTSEGDETGFRIAEVPEPSSISILAIGAIGLLRRHRR